MKKYFITIISITFFALFDCKGSNQEKKNEQILYVKVNELLVRENSDRQSKKIGSLKRGDKVIVIKESELSSTIDGITGKWVQFQYNENSTGWVFKGYLSSEMPKKIIFDFPKVELSIPENCNFANLAELNPEYVSFTDAGSGAGISSITIIKNVSLKDLENVFDNCRQVEPYGFFESVNAYNKLLKDGEFSVKTKTDSATKSLNIEINQTDGNIIIQASVRYDNPMPY